AGGVGDTVGGAAAPGSGAVPRGGALEVVVSRPADEADDVLARPARQLGAGPAVVTSDRAVRDATGRAGCAVIGAERFLEAMSAEPEPPAATSPARKSGNPRRQSKDARAAERALRRLRGP